MGVYRVSDISVLKADSKSRCTTQLISTTFGVKIHFLNAAYLSRTLFYCYCVRLLYNECTLKCHDDDDSELIRWRTYYQNCR